ncbi:MAG: site-specific integrase [Salinibacterium sp.]|nr:site-specific integrase [Salinibacterium sp.]
MASISSYETKDGKRYRAHYRDPDRRNREKAGFTRKRDAEEFLAGVVVTSLRGEYVDPSQGKATIRDLGNEWLANQSHLKPSSHKPVEIAWRVHVEPSWGSRRVSEILHSDVQSWITIWGNGRSATTVLRAYGVLAGILDVAVRDRRIAVNPARDVKLPRKPKSKHKYLTMVQVELLVAQVREHKVLTYVLAYTGMRWGEATGLRVGSVDRKRRRLLVEENAVMVAGTVHVGTPKTHEKRSVPYPAFLDEAMAELCVGRNDGDVLFGDGVTHLKTPHSVTGWFVQAVMRSQQLDPTFLRVTPHDLRHTAASLAISAGANVKAVQRMLGHASAAMTLDTYTDLFEDDLDEVSARLDEMRAKTLVGIL